MNIKRFSELTNVSAYTLRYYEKIGLLRGVRRKENGHREFTQNDVEWVAFIKRLKDVGMTLEKIQHYADLREQGAATVEPRKKILEDHVGFLEERIHEEQDNLNKLREKIQVYQNMLEDNKTV